MCKKWHHPQNVQRPFLVDTEILTREGEESIEQIQVGDLVIADVPTTLEEIEARQVVQTFVREWIKITYRRSFFKHLSRPL